jgi:hypothetical protein
MKKLDLNDYGVQKMNVAEMQQIDGGMICWIDKIAKGLAIIAIVESIDIGERFMEGWDSVECNC